MSHRFFFNGTFTATAVVQNSTKLMLSCIMPTDNDDCRLLLYKSQLRLLMNQKTCLHKCCITIASNTNERQTSFQLKTNAAITSNAVEFSVYACKYNMPNFYTHKNLNICLPWFRTRPTVLKPNKGKVNNFWDGIQIMTCSEPKYITQMCTYTFSVQQMALKSHDSTTTLQRVH